MWRGSKAEYAVLFRPTSYPLGAVGRISQALRRASAVDESGSRNKSIVHRKPQRANAISFESLLDVKGDSPAPLFRLLQLGRPTEHSDANAGSCRIQLTQRTDA